MSAKGQKVIIKIGHQQILLPDDTGVAQAVKTLSRGMGVYFSYGKEVRLDMENPEISVEMRYLPRNAEFADKEGVPISQPKPQPEHRVKRLKAPRLPALPEKSQTLFRL